MYSDSGTNNASPVRGLCSPELLGEFEVRTSVLHPLSLSMTLLLFPITLRKATNPRHMSADTIQLLSRKLPPSHTPAIILKKRHCHPSRQRLDRRWTLLLLMISGDVHPNPGPALGANVFPCGWCETKCGWSREAICCDNCSIWFHRSCISMSKETYGQAGGSDVSWRCYRCKTMNVTSCYHAYNVSTSNSFSVLRDLDNSVFDPPDMSVGSPCSEFDPGMASSPRGGSRRTDSHLTSRSSKSSKSSKYSSSVQQYRDKKDKLRFLVLNANSVRGKTAELEHICDYTCPDIVIISETKLDKTVYTAEFLPKNYTAVRKDRTLHGGGCLGCCSKWSDHG